MNPMPPTDPLDQHEREFARILRALPAGEPPAALDARILRAATDAAAHRGRRRVGWLGAGGALWGIGSAAAAVLALGVGWQALYGDHRPNAPMSKPVPVEDAADSEGITVEFKDHSSLADQARNAPGAPPPNALPRAAPVPAAPAVAKAPPRVLAPIPLRPAAMAAAPPAPDPFPDNELDENVARHAEATVAQPVATDAMRARRQAAGGQMAKAAAARQDNSPAGRVAAQAADAADLASATPGTASADASHDAKPGARLLPSTWLTQVRALRDRGEVTKARARLLEFQRQYPHWIIPTDLAPLLRE
jgi:hypothetical protein